MQAFGLSLIKGRLGSDQERREIQTSPERKTRPRPGLRERPEGPRPRTPPPRRSRPCVRGPDLDRSESTRTRSCLMPTTMQIFALGNARRASRGRQTPRRREPWTDIPSAPRSRQAMVVGEQSLVKAGLRPPPPAASALTRLRSPTSRSAQEIEGRERASSPSQHSPPREAKKSAAPY